MKLITLEDYNNKFCNGYEEKYEDIPSFIPTSTIDPILRAICRFSQGTGSIFEIGTWIGRSALGFSQNYDKVITIDSILDSDVPYSYRGMRAGELILEKDNVELIKINSKDFNFSEHEKEFDAVYVDGNHTTAGCMQDIMNAQRIIKPGGLIFVDDYFNPCFGVRPAFDQVKCAEKFRIEGMDIVFIVGE